MPTPYLGELKLITWNFAPRGWAFCNGQLLPINQNQALFSLMGTRYGGNGQTTFGLPDLRGRSPIHQGNGHIVGQATGEEFHTLTLQELPQHIHTLQASANPGTQAVPAALAAANNGYGPPTNLTAIRPDSLTSFGGSQPHENRPPSLVLNWIVALQGVFPSRQ